jgi:OHCU decarboxylase
LDERASGRHAAGRRAHGRRTHAKAPVVMSLDELNRLPYLEFVRRLEGIFEHSPWVAERVAGIRPFCSCRELHAAMCAAVENATDAEQLALIRAHPRLGLRGRARADLTRASSSEQRGAGLDEVRPDELARLEALNRAYEEKFAMPFILAVRGHTPESILRAGESRLGNELSVERATALQQIGLIAGYRLAAAVADEDATDG